MKTDQQLENSKSHESFIRWQNKTNEQFGYALNLILGLSVASLGYEFSFLQNTELNCWQTTCVLLSILSLSISITLGLWCIINRLKDFRLTAEIARKRENGDSEIILSPLRFHSRNLGEKTWFLFWGQILSFGVGILLVTPAIIIGSTTKLITA